jgi:glycosyltransferase involved in cell wall biosynthesis
MELGIYQEIQISIIMPTYNRVGLLGRAVQSIRAQSFSAWELIVINDASTDGTATFLDDLAQRDPRIRPVHNQKNNYPDISKNLNEGLALARGKYIARLDDDDYWCDDEKLKKQLDFLESHQNYVVTGGGTIVIDDGDEERFRYFKTETDENIRRRALFTNPFTHSTVMFRRDVALAVGGYGNFKNAEDWDLWLKLGTQGQFYNFQEYFVRYLMNDQSKTVIFKQSQTKEIFTLLRSHRHHYPHFFFAYALNFGQYCFSLLPRSLQKTLYTNLSRAKRNL